MINLGFWMHLPFLPLHQSLAEVVGIQPQAFANVLKGKKTVIVLFREPLFSLLKKRLLFASLSSDILLKARHRILQDSQHKPFFRLKVGLPAIGFQVLLRQKGIRLEERRYPIFHTARAGLCYHRITNHCFTFPLSSYARAMPAICPDNLEQLGPVSSKFW